MLFASAPREAPLALANAPFCSRAIAAQLSPPSATSRSHSTMGVSCADAADHDTFLHSVARDGVEDPVRLNAHAGDNFGAAPDPTGRRIAYHSNRPGHPDQ